MANPNQHSPATVDRALTLLLFGSLPAQVARILSEEFGTSVSPQSIIAWRDRSHVKRYAELHEKYKEQIESDAIRRIRERLRLVDQAEMLAVSKVITELEQGNLKGKDASAAALNMSQVKAKNVEKLMQLTGRPTEIIEDRSGSVTSEVLRELMGKGVIKPMVTGNSNGKPEDEG